MDMARGGSSLDIWGVGSALSRGGPLGANNAMLYGVWCVMPKDRWVYVDENEIVRPLDEIQSSLMREKEEEIEQKVLFQDQGQQSMQSVLTNDLGRRFGFTYSKFLIFSHEKLLRDIMQTKYSIDESLPGVVPNQDELKELVNSGYISPYVVVKHVGDIDGIDVGFGLFCHQAIEPGTFLGEYVGMVGTGGRDSSNDDNSLAYCCQYASCDGDLHVNALEYGNIIRFINHSITPNAALRVTQLDGLPHILCFATHPIGTGEQVFINYGASYWQRRESHRVDITSD